ncbi:MAG: NTP transferase domain-containing protein [Chthonomonadales bacterium]
MSNRPPLRSAIVLAAGQGRRFWPFSEVRNKCAFPVGNVPNVRRVVQILQAAGVERVVVVVSHHSASVRAALAGLDRTVAIAEAGATAGTAGALLTGLRLLDDGQLLVAYGDTVLTEASVQAVRQAEAPAAALVTPMPNGEGTLWYGAHVEGGVVRDIVAHDADADTRLCGLFVVPREIEPYLVDNPGFMGRVPVGGMPPLEPDLAQSLADWAGTIAAVYASDFVVDMDKPWHGLEANLQVAHDVTSRLPENRIHPTARIHDSAEISGFVEVGARSVIGPRVIIGGNTIIGTDTTVTNGAILRGRNVIGDRCRVSDYCLVSEGSVIGHRCIVGHGAELDGVLLDGAYLYHYCEISGVVGQSVDIGAATVCGTLRFDDGAAEHRIGGRRERPAFGANASYFGDFSRTGVNVITMPGAKIGAYSCVGAGIVVYEDVPSRTLLLLKQDTVSRPWGPERYGW